MKLFAVLFSLISFGMTAQEFPSLQWEQRIICITSETFDDDNATRQIKMLAKDERGKKERKLVVLHCTSEMCRNAFTKASISATPSEQESMFTVRLIGLDGGVKFTSETPVPLQTFYELIDQMPMRQSELRTKN